MRTHNMNKLQQEGIDLFTARPHRQFSYSDFEYLQNLAKHDTGTMVIHDYSRAIMAALYAGYALGYKHGQIDERNQHREPLPDGCDL